MSEKFITDLYELTMAQVYFKQKRKVFATFDLFIRSNKRPFYVACGIDDALETLRNFSFTSEDIEYLKSLGLFEDDFLQYLRDFRFKGEVWAVNEPEIVFPLEPIMRVTANIIEAQIVESILLNKINLATMLATKALRIVLAAKGRGVYDFSLRRTQGIEASLASAKYSYIAGVKGTSNVYAGLLYDIPVVGTMAHSYVMSFDKEIDSFLAFARQFPTKSILLVDTYDTKKGVVKAIRVAKILKKIGCNLLGIRLDSGDLLSDSKYARFQLDEAGLIDTIILASGDLDEYKINDLISKKAPIDAFGVGTNMGCSSDLPYTDVIYKLVEIRDNNRSFVPTMKLSEDKTTLPSRKQVYRIFYPNGVMKEDYICLDKEKFKGKKLLKKMMHKGERLFRRKSIKEKRQMFLGKVQYLPQPLREIDKSFCYSVHISDELKKLIEEVKKSIKIRTAKKVIFIDIDTQFDFLSKKGSLYVKGAEKIISNIKRLTQLAKSNNIPIISSQDTHSKNDNEFKKFGVHCIKGSKGQRKIIQSTLKKYKVISYKKIYSEDKLRDIISRYPQIIIEKNVLNMFSNPNTAGIMDIISPEDVYVYGVATDYCVREVVEELLRQGFSVIVIQDAIKEISPLEKRVLFSSWKSRGVKFIKTDSLIKKGF